jgi:hypothetical protein
MVDCNISPHKIETHWRRAMQEADGFGWGIHDNRYWKYCNSKVKNEVAQEGCQSMMKGSQDAHQSRALRGLLSSILSEYEAENRGMSLHGD